MELTVGQLAKQIGAELISDGSAVINAVQPVGSANKSHVTFITNDRHLAELKQSQAAAVITAKQIDDLAMPQLVAENVDAALIEALTILAPQLNPPAEGIAPTAVVSESAKIAKNVSIEPGVVIEAGVEIGENTVIASGCKIGENTTIGSNCRLNSNVVVYHNCTIGNCVIIQANSTIGATGFGYSFIDGAHKLIPHNGVVVIEDFVEIGANSCIDRAKFDETRIGAGTKIDNLVQIAHNVIIGKCCLIAGQVAIAGSCKLGNGVVMGGRSGLADNVELADGVMVGGITTLFRSVKTAKQLFGFPATEKIEAIRIIGLTKRLPKMAERLKQLVKRIEKLETSKNNKS